MPGGLFPAEELAQLLILTRRFLRLHDLDAKFLVFALEIVVLFLPPCCGW